MQNKKRKKKKQISKGRRIAGKIVLGLICVWLCIGAFFLLRQTLFSDEKESSEITQAAADTRSDVEAGINESLVQNYANSIAAQSSSADEELPAEESSEESGAREPSTQEDLTNYDKMERLAKKVVQESTSDEDSDLYKLYNTYWWIKNRMKYTGTSNKNGWINEAIHGFETLSGDCYTHYAMMKAVMRVMGFETIDIERLGGETRHYWNLVKYNGQWYHIDSCPRSEDKDKYWYCFLRTDEELLEWDRHQDAAKGYYTFDPSLYPATATEPLGLGRMQSRK